MNNRAEELNNFLNILEKEGYKKSTINSYSFCLNDFFKYLNAVGVGHDNFNNNHVKNFIETLKIKNAPQTVNSKIFAILKFANYLRKYKNTNIILDLELIKTHNKKELKSVGDIDIILNHIKQEAKDERVSLRDQLLISFIYYSGLRTKDILKIKISDVKGEKINIGNNQVVLNNKVINKVNRYINLMNLGQDNFLFFNFSPSQNNKNKKESLTEKTAQDLFNKYKVIINSDLSIRDLRHSYISNLSEYFSQIKIVKNYSYTENETDLDYLSYRKVNSK